MSREDPNLAMQEWLVRGMLEDPVETMQEVGIDILQRQYDALSADWENLWRHTLVYAMIFETAMTMKFEASLVKAILALTSKNKASKGYGELSASMAWDGKGNEREHDEKVEKMIEEERKKAKEAEAAAERIEDDDELSPDQVSSEWHACEASATRDCPFAAEAGC